MKSLHLLVTSIFSRWVLLLLLYWSGLFSNCSGSGSRFIWLISSNWRLHCWHRLLSWLLFFFNFQFLCGSHLLIISVLIGAQTSFKLFACSLLC